MMRGHHRLRPLAVSKVDAEDVLLDRLPIRRDFQRQRRAAIPMPGFGGVDPVPMRALAGPAERSPAGAGARQVSA